MFEGLPVCVLMHPIVYLLIVRRPKRLKGFARTECSALRSEVGPANIDHINRIAGRRRNFCEIVQRNPALGFKNCANVFGPGRDRHVPLADIADALGML